MLVIIWHITCNTLPGKHQQGKGMALYFNAAQGWPGCQPGRVEFEQAHFLTLAKQMKLVWLNN